MTDDELFTAVYFVCGSLPAQPQSQRMIAQMATMYRRKLPGNKEQMWMVADEVANLRNYDVRITHDPAYMEYFDKAAAFGLDLAKFSQYIAWAEAYEARRQ